MTLTGMRALILSADNFEDTELLVPYYRLLEEGLTVDIASNKTGSIRGKHGYEMPINKTFAEISPADYGVLVLPGGKAPAAIRDDKTAQEIARSFMSDHKPIAAICHGPQLLISANLVRGRKCTCYKEVTTELREAGAQYSDTEVLVDGNLISSREPKDLPAFNRELIRMLKQREI